MLEKNKIIDEYIRRQRIRKTVIFILVASLFVAFMSYALYKSYGTPTVVDISIKN